MAIKFDKLVPGMTLFDCHKHRTGNTMIRVIGCWEVRVVSVDAGNRTAMCSWNGNPARIYHERDFKGLSLKKSRAYLAQEERRRLRGGSII